MTEEYDYDAAADSIKIEDITSDEINREILRRLKENDPTFVELWVVGNRGGLGEKIKEFHYCPEGARDLGWLGYFIGKNTTNLRELRLVSNPFRGLNDSIEQFIRGVNSNRSIRTIYFDRMELSGGEIFESLILNELHSLNLHNNAVDDGGVDTLVAALTNSNLRILFLSFTRNISARGWQSVASLLENPNSKLEALVLDGNYLGDEGALIFANVLANNCKLKTLNLWDTGITAQGWAGFSKVLCNTSSVNNTFLSNHTLQSLSHITTGMPDDVISLLALNRSSKNKMEAAIQKILRYHQHFDMQPFFEWELKVLPLAIAWFDRAQHIELSAALVHAMPIDRPSVVHNIETRIGNRKLDAIYQFIRAMPDVFESVPAVGGEMTGKRKRSAVDRSYAGRDRTSVSPPSSQARKVEEGGGMMGDGAGRVYGPNDNNTNNGSGDDRQLEREPEMADESAEMAAMRARLERVESEKEQLQTSLKRVENEKEELQTILKSSQDEVARAEREKEELETKLRTNDLKMQADKELIEVHRKILVEVERKKDQLQGNNKRLRALLSSLGHLKNSNGEEK